MTDAKNEAAGGASASNAGLATTQTAKERYDKLCNAELEPDPLERLRFFCSLAMNGQDWLDVEPFFDDVKTMTACG